VDERHPIADAELHRPLRGPGQEMSADVDSDTDNTVVTSPRREHLARAAREVEHGRIPWQTQRVAKRRELASSNGL
jgi:hypothetical protein